MELSPSMVVTTLIVLALIAELWRHRHEAWALPALVMFITVLVWYCADILFYPEKYLEISPVQLVYAYAEVLLFVLAFRMMAPFFAKRLIPQSPVKVPRFLEPTLLLQAAIGLWAVLFCCGLYRMQWDVLATLFPVNARNGSQMWSREAAGDAGPTGFLVSTGGYLYVVACALFGMAAVLTKSNPVKVAAGSMMALTWPYFLLIGTRNAFLAVCMPWVFCYALMGRQKMFVRSATLVICFLCINFAFTIVIGYRNVGFMAYFEQSDEELMAEGMTQDEKSRVHEGLNMLQELCYENSFLSSNQVHLAWGWDYFVQVSGFVPRAIWPNKPLMGMEYAKARGFGGGDSDIGVVATVSRGLIGQGVLEFGPFFGPIFQAFLMAVWSALLARWWMQRVSLLRMSLFMIALGITFNLGRDIASITLWPVIFAYAFVVLAEKVMKTRLVPPVGVRLVALERAARLRRMGNLPAPRPASLRLAPVGTDVRPT